MDYLKGEEEGDFLRTGNSAVRSVLHFGLCMPIETILVKNLTFT